LNPVAAFDERLAPFYNLRNPADRLPIQIDGNPETRKKPAAWGRPAPYFLLHRLPWRQEVSG
jgi:hypothetical protein